MMNLEDMPDINAAFDPETWEYLPLSRAAQWWCVNLSLPMLEEDFAAGSRTALNEALQLIALHQVAPPPWLAAAMLKEFKVKPRANAVTVEKALAAWLAVRAAKVSLDEVAEKLNMDPSTLDRLLKFYREHEAKLNRLADKLP